MSNTPREDVIKLAREAGFGEMFSTFFCGELEHLCALAVAKAVAEEREACAMVCDRIDLEYEGEDVQATWCAAAIRVRSNT